MSRLFRAARKKVGRSPGTVEYVGEKKVEKIKITVIDYDEVNYDEREVSSPEECFAYKQTPTVSWINIDGLHETGPVESLGRYFGLHPLVQEDIVHTGQRPKLETFPDYLYIVVRVLSYDDDRDEISSEQMSVILGSNYVLSFQEREGDVFNPIRRRLREGKGRARRMAADYLAYALIDAVVDNYFLVLEKLGERIESLEEGLVKDPTPEVLQTIHALKREMIHLRKSVWPLREVIGGLERDESGLVKEATSPFLRDLYDHTIQVIDAVESFRDMLSGMQDLYLSSISNKMNEVMKVLTIAATIFVPLTFIAGIYGMNFEFMPELKWRWAYLCFWAGIALVVGTLVTYFRRRRWL